MKKKFMLTIGVLISAVILGIGIYHSDAAEDDPTLTQEEVKELVSEQYPGTITELELGKDLNQAVYSMVIERDDKQYDLKIDASSGEVLELKEKEIAQSSENDKESKAEEKLTLKEKKEDSNQDNQDNSEKEGNENKEKSAKAKDNKKSEQKKEKNNEDSNVLIDISEATEIALKEFSGTVTEVELEEEDGRLIYEVEVEAGEQEAEIEIDAYTGEVLVIEIDD